MSAPSRRVAMHAFGAAAVGVLLLRTSAATSPRDTFDELYARGRKVNAAISTLTARFTETTTSALLTRPLVAHGRLSVERPSRVILRYTDPDTRIVLIDGDSMTVTWPIQKVRRTTDITAAQRRVQKYFVNGTASDLRGQFDVADRGSGGDLPNAYHVSMVPKRRQIREALTRLDLWVDRTSLLLTAMTMTFANGETKTMAFEDVVPDAPLDAGTFALDR